MKTILVLSPHPDDESIGCGGTLRRHVLEGATVHVIFLTSGEAGGHGRTAEATRRLREREARRAMGILGVRQFEFWRAPDGALRAQAALVQRLRATLRAVRPQRVYVPHEQEAHPDHRAAARLLRAAKKGGRMPDLEVLGYEVWTPIQRLGEIVDITRTLRTKLRAVRAYRCQCAEVAFDAAIAGLNRYRGEMHSWPGGAYAEVFTRWDV
jgi:LmbE family N-acetylglucosaminyl deacetylase